MYKFVFFTLSLLSLCIICQACSFAFKPWTLVFKARAGNGESVLHTFVNGSDKCTSRGVVGVCDGHYRNKIIDRWEDIVVHKVKLELFEHCKRVAYIVFRGKGSDKTSWLDKSRVLTSSWSDITSWGNYFSFYGVKDSRRLYINKRWAGCANDIGWLMVSDSEGSCFYEKHDNYPVFLYSRKSVASNPNHNYRKAEVLAISVVAEKLSKCV